MPSLSNFVVQVMDLPAEGITLEGEVPVREFEFEDDGRFALEGATLRYRLHVSLVKRTVFVMGRLELDTQAMCDRCTEWAPLHLTEPEVIHSIADETLEPVDFTEDIREDVVLMLPTSFLCKEECLGICPTCGKNLNEGPCGCECSPSEDDEDSPWAALSGLQDKM